MAIRDQAIIHKTMSAIKGKDTGIEKALRKALTEEGLRYRIYSNKVIGHPDILFPKEKVVVFADSEFWHGYNFESAKANLKTNRDSWVNKIERNIKRDKEVNEALLSEGYKVLRYWGFEINKELPRIVAEIKDVLKRRQEALARKAGIPKKDRTTLGYIHFGDKVLLLYRNKKENDPNQGKYVGIGGHFEGNESPFACIKREIKEETGLLAKKAIYKGKVYFLNDTCPSEVMYLFNVFDIEGDISSCDEGTLSLVSKDEVYNLPMWEGDRYFLPLMMDNKDGVFELTLIYHGDELIDKIGPFYKEKPKKKKRGKKHGRNHD